MKLLRCVVALLVTLAMSSAAQAQQTESRLVGTIADQSQSVLPGVTVTIVSADTGAERVAVTEADGRFSVTNLSRGTYTVRAALDGFRQVEQTVVLGVGEVKTVDVALSVATMAETVTVTADARALDASSAKIGVNVTPEEVDNLPVNGRNFANLMTLSPGATTDGNGGWSSIRFNGKSNQQNYLNYDGV
ncbi:MAG TPA: carboxypeptidase-like regulatory domain-containing protein, partial [Luteitalea sp.]|nr:carboxypeptidase-like regulatory domain-containing protein [Luteitalea sp.]